MFLKIFGCSLGVSVVGFALGFLYGGATGLAMVAILAILEVSLSFDNAVVNATVLARLSVFWQTIFLTVGIAIAVFGMRLLFPLLLVSITAGLMPVEAIQLAMEKGDPDTPGTYGYLLHEAHPSIAAFGGMFLLMLFLDFILEEREITWLSWLERPLARIGRLNHLPVVIALITLCVAASQLAPEDKVTTVLFSGALGLVTYMLVNGLGELFESGEPPVDNDGADIEERADKKDVVGAVGKHAFFLFLYLEILDASFSFDGVVGAFAITSDPIIIALAACRT